MEDKYKLIAFHYYVMQIEELNEEIGQEGSIVDLAAAYFVTENIVKGDYLKANLKYEQIDKAFKAGKHFFEQNFKGSDYTNMWEKMLGGSMTPDQILQHVKGKEHMS